MAEPPEYEDAVVTFKDKPPLATMLSGGLFMSIFLFFIFDYITRNLDFPGSELIPTGVAFVVILLTVVRSRQIDGLIKINTKSGWVYGSSRSLFWEGYIHEAKQVIVLQRERSVNEDTSYVEYKLSLTLEDENSFEIGLTTDLARIAIDAIEKAKSAIPVSKDQEIK